MSSCGSCGTKSYENGKTLGCKSNGGCSSGGCNKMNVFDWLSNMDMPPEDIFDIAEIRFKNGRKDFYRNVHKLDLYPGDAVVVDVPSGHHIGHVSMQGELVRLQMQKKKIKNDEHIKSIYRLATKRDLDKYEEVKNKENDILIRTRQVIGMYQLKMKLTDVDFQADGAKATFYYSSDQRVDFRDLIKALASEFHIRVEMRQINMRQEAARLGGIGSCGRELCCSTWLTDFKNVATSAARYQNLALNPSKLSGQCGRLKCCLNYELDTYMDALDDIPKVNKSLKTSQGDAKLQKTDIFRKIMWFSLKDEMEWIALSTDRVKEIQELNAEGELPDSLLQDDLEEIQHSANTLNGDLEKMDKKYKTSSPRKKKNNKRRRFSPKNKNRNKPSKES